MDIRAIKINRNSTIRDVETAHIAYSIKQIAVVIGIGEQKLKRILSFCGFEYDSSIKKWRYVLQDETRDARDFTVYEIERKLDNNERLFPLIEPSDDETTTDITPAATADNEQIQLDILFDIAEIAALKEIAARHINNKSNTSNIDYSDFAAIKGYKIKDVTRKTYALDSNVSNQLDAFCSKNGLKKTQVLSLAIKQFLSNFE